MVNLAKVSSLSGWPGVRGQIESAVLSVLGPIASKDRVELQTKTVDELSFPGHVRRRVNYFVDEWERVSAWLFVPERKDEMPAILCCHSAVPQGKDETAGLEGEPLLALAQHYAELGYVTIAPDCITAGDRISTGLAPYDTKSFYKDYPKMSAMGKMLSDHMYAMDVLCEVKRVDSARMGVVGHGWRGERVVSRRRSTSASRRASRVAGSRDSRPTRIPSDGPRDSGFVIVPAAARGRQEARASPSTGNTSSRCSRRVPRS